MSLYYKQGKRYHKIEGENLPSDGLWLVSKNGKSKTRIQKIASDEFLDSVSDSIILGVLARTFERDLASFMNWYLTNKIEATFTKDTNGSIHYSLGSAHDAAMKLLEFLSMSTEDREKTVESIRPFYIKKTTLEEITGERNRLQKRLDEIDKGIKKLS